MPSCWLLASAVPAAGRGLPLQAWAGDDGGMSRGLEVAFTDGRVFFPAGHLSRIGGTFDGMLAASAIRDADPAATPPEIRRRPDIWGDLLEPFVDTEFTPEDEAATLSRLRQTGLTDIEIAQARAKAGPLILAYNAFHWDWAHLGLADLFDALTTDSLPDYLRAGLRVEEIRAEFGETASF
jgi:hypothetical protein